MRLARLYVILALVVFAYCEEPATDDVATTSPTVQQDEQSEDVKEKAEIATTEEDIDTLKIQDPLDPKNSQLPILPPLILLDFGNDDENSTSGDEKSKRTIDGNLGYGFGRNDLFSGKSNYYFPAGKSGTTVSIEESISPFQPKTIYENVKPISEKPFAGEQNNGYGQNPLQQKNLQALAGQQQQAARQSVQGQNNQAQSVPYPQPVFGQRTKLYKPSQIDYSAYQGFGSTPQSTIESYTTPRPDYRANGFAGGQNTFSTPKPGFPSGAFTTGFPQGTYTTQRPFASYSTTARPSYVTPTPSSYQSRYTANVANSFGTSRPSFDGITTPRPQNFGSQGYSPDASLASFSNLPRYTIENGVRYENKIIWKYPDGKISQTPPSSYINAYNEFLSKQNPGAVPQAPGYQNVGNGAGFPNPGSSGSYQNLGAGVNYQNLGGQTSFQNPNYQSQFVRYQNPQETRFPAESLGNIYSKSPAQFPKDQEPNKPRQSPFVSSASLQAANFGTGSRAPQVSPAPQGQSYELGYQGQFGLRTSQLLGNSAGSPGFSSSYPGLQKDNTKLSKGSYRTSYEKERLVPKYEVNSPNPEYTYTTEPSVKSSTSSSNLFTPSGTLAPKILSKYSTQAQKYLKNVFTPEKSAIRKYQASLPSSAGQSYTTPAPSFSEQSYTTPAPSFGGQSYTTSAPSFGGQSYTTSAPSFAGQSYTTAAPSFAGQSYTTPPPNFAGQSYTTAPPNFAGQSYTTAAPNFGGQSYTTSAPNFGGQSYTTAAPNFAGQSYSTPAPSFSGQSYTNPSAPYINTDYEHLLNYNPSISQYIRNPQSILKAQPTYIQAGNSLIPVIILRVDGAPPVQPKVTPNINLKALLQQYLTQYAGSIGQNGNDFGGASGKHGDAQQSSLQELNQLAQTLSQYSRDSQANNRNQSPYETSNSYPTKTGGGLSSYGSRTKTQKVKSVQIIEDPRYTSYKVES